MYNMTRRKIRFTRNYYAQCIHDLKKTLSEFHRIGDVSVAQSIQASLNQVRSELALFEQALELAHQHYLNSKYYPYITGR